MLIAATSAAAATRFAAPGGTGAAPCEEREDPCSLFDAASLAAPVMPAKPGDVVFMAPGNYTDAAGLADPTPAVYRWKVLARR
jgi:hypothetical protein